MDLKKQVKESDPENFSDFGWKFGDKLLDYEFDSNLTVEEIAKIIGVGIGDIFYLELGVSHFTDKQLKEFEKKLEKWQVGKNNAV